VKYIDEYRNKDLVLKIAEKIRGVTKKDISLMEVCGGHTMAIHKFGIPSLLPENITLLSGPGCPVCVTGKSYIDQAVLYSRMDDTVITTYGDLIRVPGSVSSLEIERASGRDIRIVYSTLEALDIAKKEQHKNVIFLGIGFETTSPSSAAAIIKAKNDNINNFYLFSSHKIMPPAMAALIDEGVKLNGYICPGHVSTITGSGIYKPIPEKYGLGCVVSGFEALDILQSIYMLSKQIEDNDPKVEIAYKRAVRPEGNLKAKAMLDEVFESRDDWWRGFGILPDSGFGLKEQYSAFDTEKRFDIVAEEPEEEKGCICGEILKGQKTPKDCTLFAKVCDPSNPIGACMVSNEGACHAYYRYNR